MSTVLIVEDDLIIADLIQDELEADGYFVTGIARTVDEAMDLVAETKPDYAVIDLHLANGELGTDVGYRLRKDTSVGILYSTGSGKEPFLRKEVGDAVMTKPHAMADIGRGLEIIGELARSGMTALSLPQGFRFL
jgi:DNA-binding response OmpR family regulator